MLLIKKYNCDASSKLKIESVYLDRVSRK